MKITPFVLLFCTLVLSACASAPQTEALRKNSATLLRDHEIANVPFIVQTQNSCGPATLAMVARFAGVWAPVDDLVPLMFTPGKNGTLQTDYLGAARRTGLLAVEVGQLRKLIEELRADHPVVVLQNLATGLNPQWHYAVVYGYDLAKEELTLHSGTQEVLKMKFSEFERTWKGADYWAAIVTSPKVLPATASAKDMTAAASALERVGKNLEAHQAYETILAKWPTEAGAVFGLGNTAASLGNWKEAAQEFERASNLVPTSVAVWTNLSEAYSHLKQKKKAANAKKKARKLKKATPQMSTQR